VPLLNRGGSSFAAEKVQAIEKVPVDEQLVVRDVPLMPIDAVIARPVDVMKIDVEGAQRASAAVG
jgi:hypothetical protein